MKARGTGRARPTWRGGGWGLGRGQSGQRGGSGPVLRGVGTGEAAEVHHAAARHAGREHRAADHPAPPLPALAQGAAATARRAGRVADLGELARAFGEGRGRGGEAGRPGRTGPREQRRREGNERQSGQQSLRRNQTAPQAGASYALTRVAGYSLAPQRRGLAVPGHQHGPQLLAPRLGVQRPLHHPGRLQLRLHPLHPYGRVLRGQLQGGGHLGPGQLAGALQPPQRQQRPVVGLQPAGGTRRLAALARQVQAHDRQVDEVGPRVGQVVGRVQGGALSEAVLTGLPVRADPVHRDRHQPGTEALVRAQAAQPVERTQHGVLHHVVHVEGPVQGAPDDVVDQRKVGGDELVLRPGVARAGRCHQRCRLLSTHVMSLSVPAVDDARYLGDRRAGSR